MKRFARQYDDVFAVAAVVLLTFLLSICVSICVVRFARACEIVNSNVTYIRCYACVAVVVIIILCAK